MIGRSKDEALSLLHERISNMLVEMSELFVPGVKTTFIARRPGKPEQDVLVTDDTMDELELLLQRSRKREPKP